MSIKISTLRSVLHDSDDFDIRSKAFLESIEDHLGEELVVTDIEDYNCDLKLIFVESGGSEGLLLEQFDKLQEPYYILTSGDNNSLAASLEIMTYLNQNHKKGEIIHGSIAYVAERIRKLAKQNVAICKLHNTRLGVIGKPSDWLISSIPDYQKVKDRFGIELVDIPLSLVIEKYNKADISKYKETEKLVFDEKELEASKKVYIALSEIKDEYHLNGLTIRCFDLLDSIHTTGCLSLAFLNKHGIIGTCEGDVTAMITMQIVKYITGQSTFQANPSRINTDTNEITLAHCTIPFDMLKDFHLDTHFESGIGVAVKGELFEDAVTIFRLSSDMEHYFIAEGKIQRNLNETNLCRTQIVVKLDESVEPLLKNPCGNHHIIFYGRHKKTIEDLLRNM